MPEDKQNTTLSNDNFNYPVTVTNAQGYQPPGGRTVKFVSRIKDFSEQERSQIQRRLF